MRRLCLLFALVGLMSAILAGAGGAADARTPHRKVKPKKAGRPAAAAIIHPPRKRRLPARTTRPVDADAPTSPDVIARRLMIVGFDGRGAQVARTAAAEAFRNIGSVRVVPLRPTDAMRIGTAYGAEKTVGLAQRLNLTAVLFGTITQARRDVRLSMQLANGEDGRVVGEITFQARSLGALRGKVRAQLWSKLGPLIDQAASPGPKAQLVAEGEPGGAGATPPETPGESPKPSDKRVPRPLDRPREVPAEAPTSEAEPPAEPAKEPTIPGRRTGGDHRAAPDTGAAAPPTTDEEEAPSPDTTAAAGDGKRRSGESGSARAGHAGDSDIAGVVEERTPATPERCPIAEVSPGAGVMARRYNYRGEQTGALRGYALYRAPVGRIDGALYPFSGASCRVGTGLGLRGSYEIMGPVTSQVGGRKLGTQASGYELDLVLRMVRGALTLQPAAGFLARQYHVDGQVVPSADYRAVGGGLDVALRGRYLGIGLGVAGWKILSVGQLQSAAWFPQQSRFALSAHAQASVAVSPRIDIVAGATAEYETFTFTVDQGAANVNGIAAGAYDLYVQGTVSVRFRLGMPAAPGPIP